MPPDPLRSFRHIRFIDHNVRVLGGHHYEFIRSVVAAARRLGLPLQFFVDRHADPGLVAETEAAAVFEDREGLAARGREAAFWRRFPRVASVWFCAWQNWRFGQDLERCFARLDWDRTLVVVPNCSAETVVALSRALSRRLNADNHALLVFPYNPSKVTFPLAFRALVGLVRENKVTLGCDSDPLAAHYERLTGLTFHRLPMPYQIPSWQVERKPAVAAPLRLLAPGEMRSEKGSDVLVAALEGLHDALTAGRLSMVIQTYLNPVAPDPVAVKGRGRLLELAGRYAPGAITLIDEPLASDAYHDLLAGCDATVLPYRKQAYAMRTSGVLMESLALGKPIVTTAETWLEHQMRAHGAGVVFADGDAPALAAALRQLVEDYPRLSLEARSQGEAWRQFHNPENYLRIVCELGQQALERPRQSS